MLFAPTKTRCMIMVSVVCEILSSQIFKQSLTQHPIVGFGESVARVLEASRVSVAWIPVGICQGAIEKTISYAIGREAFGAVLSANQLVQGKRRSEWKV